MTCIVGLVETETGRVWMGGDSAGTDGYDLMVSRESKVVRNGPFLFGITGHPRMRQILEHAFAPPEHPADMSLEGYIVTRFIDAMREALKTAGYAHKDNEQERQGSQVLVGYRGRVFAIQGNYQMVEPREPYFAVGCGDMVALGSLYMTEGIGMQPALRVRRALEASEHFNGAVRGPFRILALEPEGLEQAASAGYSQYWRRFPPNFR